MTDRPLRSNYRPAVHSSQVGALFQVSAPPAGGEGVFILMMMSPGVVTPYWYRYWCIPVMKYRYLMSYQLDRIKKPNGLCMDPRP